MPEIDSELFKLLSLVLLALAVLLLLALLSSLSSIRKVLKQQLAETQDLRTSLASGSAAAPVAGESATPQEPTPAPVPEPAAATSRPGPEPEPEPAPLLGGAAASGGSPSAELSSLASEGPTGAGAATAPWDQDDEDVPPREPAGAGPEDPFATPAQPAAAADDPFARAADDPVAARESEADDPFGSSTQADDPFAATDMDDPFGSGTAEDARASQTSSGDENPFMTETEEPASQSTIDEPEEQPFERNGRWFFRRDDELLVYEEGTGEWVPADPADLAPAPAPPPVADFSSSSEEASSAGDLGTGAAAGDTARFDTVDDEPRPTGGGGFWKCPSCGAVNGSSASTCRMCFSSRP
ncbi:MAG: zinc finger Ran-binding domain-containing protein [Actinomycetota bacterium]|nr:zinc finger Ran-binding domain-containing protein [Actinomycetota bacterium]